MSRSPSNAWSQARQGVNFGYMHEDPAVERSLVQPGDKVLCVLSGGNIAYTLAAIGNHVMAADVNPAQVYLHELKSRAAQHWSADEATRLTLEQAFQHRDFYQSLSPAAWRFWQHRSYRSRPLASMGHIDQKLRFIAKWMAPWIIPTGFPWKNDGANSTSELFSSRKWRVSWQTLRLGVAVAFPVKFRRHLPEDVTTILKNRFEQCCLEHAPDCNPLLTRMLSSRPSDHAWAYSDSWPTAKADTITTLHQSLTDQSLTERYKFNVVTASNILDTEPAHALLPFLEQIQSRLVPGGLVILRSLFREFNDWPMLPAQWKLDHEALSLAATLDRAPLCKTSLIMRYLG